MITFEQYIQNNVCIGFQCKGHAGFADFGQDVACASVTSAVQLTINGITEVVRADAKVEVLENSISCIVKQPSKQVSSFLQALVLHLQLLVEDYPENIEIINLEV